MQSHSGNSRGQLFLFCNTPDTGPTAAFYQTSLSVHTTVRRAPFSCCCPRLTGAPGLHWAQTKVAASHLPTLSCSTPLFIGIGSPEYHPVCIAGNKSCHWSAKVAVIISESVSEADLVLRMIAMLGLPGEGIEQFYGLPATQSTKIRRTGRTLIPESLMHIRRWLLFTLPRSTKLGGCLVQ